MPYRQIIMFTEHLTHNSSGLSSYDGLVDDIAGHRDEVGDAAACEDALADDLGWGLGMIFRAYVRAAHAAVADLPGGPRGYQRCFPPSLRAP
jgi:hypothetical protein